MLLLLQISIAVCIALALFALGQIALTFRFLGVMRKALPRKNGEPSATDPEWNPKVAVILCLRGPDPFLGDCIRAIMNQDHANYDVHIVVDHDQDPALRIVEQSLSGLDASKVHVQFLEERLETCSLKCSSLVQAVGRLDDSYDAIAQLDADTIAHRSWLTELVAPLADPAIGAATGNRWYLPEQNSLAPLVRWLWNSAAVVQMYCYRIPWGGTLAVKTETIRRCDLMQKWSHAFCEDTMLAGVLKREKLGVAFVPSLLMTNKEGCQLGDFFRWVSRQLLTARLYHHCWPLVAGHAIISSVLMAVAVAATICGIVSSDLSAVSFAGGGYVFFQVSNFWLLVLLERSARRAIRARGEATPAISWGVLLMSPLIVCATQLVYLPALLKGHFCRQVDWRGAVYKIAGKKICLVSDEPYTEQSHPSDGQSL